jgi:hypothetical protein
MFVSSVEDRRFKKSFLDLYVNTPRGIYARIAWKPLFESLPIDEHIECCKLLNHFDVPDNFQGLKHALNSIELIATDLSEAQGDDFKTGDWLHAIGVMKLHFKSLIHDDYQRYSKTDIFGIVTKNPLYVILMTLNGDQSDFSRLVVLPLIALLLKQADVVVDKGRLYAIANQLRKLIHGTHSEITGIDDLPLPSIIESVFRIVVTPLEYDKNSTFMPTSHDYVSMLLRFNLEGAVRLIRQIKSSRGAGGGGGGKPKGAVVIGRNHQVSILRYSTEKREDFVEGADVGEFRLETYVNQNLFNTKGEPAKLIDVEDFALNTAISLPLENITRTTKRRLTRTERSSSEQDAAKRKVNAKYLGDTTIRANQRFLTNTSLLDEFTVEVFLSELNAWAKSEAFSDFDKKGHVHPTIASAVLATCFFRGKGLEDVLTLRRSKSKVLVSNHFVIKDSSPNGVEGYWIEEVPLVSMVKNNNSFNGTEDVVNEYRIPMPQWLSQLILNAEQVRNQYKQDSFVNSKAFEISFKKFGFVWTVTDFKLVFEAFFKRLRAKNPGIEINLQKVETYLLNASLHDYDAIFSAYFVGKRTLHSHTKLFYTRVKESEIHSKYVEFWEQRLIGLIHSDIDFKTLGHWPRVKTNLFVGSALVPRHDVVRKINKTFHEQLEANTISSLEDVFNYHLEYSLYTLFFFSYATGYRGVHDILPNWRLMSHDLKWVAISDKDDLDSSHARLSYLNSMIREQLKNYFNHLKNVLGKLPILDFELYKQVLDIFRDWELDLTYRKDGDRFVFDQDTIPVFFHIDYEKKSIEPLSLNYFLTQLHIKEHIGLPVNGGRHLLRTQAISESVPSDVLDAFLGHFIYGHEPHSPYSGLNLSSLESYFEPMLTRHLKALGFKPIKSRLKN